MLTESTFSTAPEIGSAMTFAIGGNRHARSLYGNVIAVLSDAPIPVEFQAITPLDCTP